MKHWRVWIFLLLILFHCKPLPPEPTPQDELVSRGREIFFNETFGGNGRTCGTCHRAENNFTIDPSFIATLPADDPLFVAEFTPALQKNFENPKLMREVGLILENLDGFDSLDKKFTMRGVPHTLGLRNSVASNNGPHIGWSGDGAPGDATLRAFATGAVIQHFTKTLNRVPGVDFRLPTEAELNALEAFQLSLGPQQELQLPLALKSPVALRGQALFNDPLIGKCSACHFNAGANADPAIFGAGAGNLNFNTGVENLPDQPADLTGEFNPPDDGLGTPGDSTFNVPPLVESADTGPFFHNNAVETIESAVGFYDGEAFNNSPAGQRLAATTGSSIELDATQIVAIAAFLRVINVLENIRQSEELINSVINRTFLGNVPFGNLIQQAVVELEDAIDVLRCGGLHPGAVAHLQRAKRLLDQPGDIDSKSIESALRGLELARDELIEKE
jgi:mono/diheme cytochrome c family protein